MTAGKSQGSRWACVVVGALVLTVCVGAPQQPHVVRTVATQDQIRAAMNAEGKVTDPVPLLEYRTADTIGWFWTLSQAEGAAAASQHGMKPVPSRLGYLRRQAFPGSTPVYRLRGAQQAEYLLTASEHERQSLVDSGKFVQEGVLGHVAARRQTGTDALYRMSNGAERRVVPAARQSEFADRGYRIEQQLGYAWPVFHRAGAIYFGTFDRDGNQAMMARTEEIHHRPGDWWGGLRDFAGSGVPRNAWHWPGEDFTDREPAIGYYDDSRPDTLRKHVVQASGAGLRYFSFYWYWNPADGGAENYTEGLKAYMAATNRGQMDFNVVTCLHPWKDGTTALRLPAEQITKAADTIVDTYLSQPNYLRANDGRPVIGVCDARGIGGGDVDHIDVEDTRQFTDAIRERARARFGEEVLITVNGVPPVGAGFDGSDCLGQFDPSRSYRAYADNQRRFFSNFPGTLLRCATSDFDERPRIGIAIGDPGPDPAALRASFRWYDDADLTGFERVLAAVRADVAESARPSTVDNFVSLYAWNEWHEGGYIEPNRRDGCAYLNAVRRQLRLVTGNGCVATPS
ncbi:glycoside hydrolase family 99-like domain-containing protein [Actinosynnema sp. ALI-1.44]|uniref:glycoside hydrolase family 99-like domain-containing protein n=1 Tax=Actinosynnema sp. ALI-1.44 TaxID=1933779 RepID=UPI00143DB868|nr:glycoside hydrolase family 99-like domain-containing protein [Actinosynnema sp. ALI-1.44]